MSSKNDKLPSTGVLVGIALVLVTFGVLSYMLWQKSKELGNQINQTPLPKDSRCQLEPNPGMCKAYIPSYYFDAGNATCKEFVWGGCEGVRPFETLQECQAACGVEDTDQKDLQTECEDIDGTWIAEYNECEWMDETTCNQLEGTFNECASPCRHQPETTICTMNCVQVCSF